MKKYIYYPNFEPPENEWLKFSILYLDKFESIIPYNRQHLISNDYRKLQNETDLVDFFSPEYYQGEQASLKAISEAERIIKRTTNQASFLTELIFLEIGKIQILGTTKFMEKNFQILGLNFVKAKRLDEEMPMVLYYQEALLSYI